MFREQIRIWEHLANDSDLWQDDLWQDVQNILHHTLISSAFVVLWSSLNSQCDDGFHTKSKRQYLIIPFCQQMTNCEYTKSDSIPRRI